MMIKVEPNEGDNPMRQYASDIAFTPAVNEIQSRKGSRSSYSKVEKGRGWQTKVTPDLTVFLSELDMFYLGTATAEGQPYIQYRARWNEQSYLR